MATQEPGLFMPDGLSELIIASLRREHPWMKIEAVHEAVQSTAENLGTKIKQQHDQMKASKARSSFMSLSAELRNHIYHLALVPKELGAGGVLTSTVISVGSPSSNLTVLGRHPRSDQSTYDIPWALQPPITMISRAVRAESLSVFYGMNHFEAYSDDCFETRVFGLDDIPSHDYDLSRLIRWLKCIGPENAALIKNLTVRHLRMPFWQEQTPSFLQAWDRMIEHNIDHVSLITKHVGFQGHRWREIPLESPLSGMLLPSRG